MVVILNGTGSSGKSSIAQRLMERIEVPTVYHGYYMLVPTLLPHRDSFKPAFDPDQQAYVRRLDGAQYAKMRQQKMSLPPLIYEFIVPLHIGGLDGTESLVQSARLLKRTLSYRRINTWPSSKR